MNEFLGKSAGVSRRVLKKLREHKWEWVDSTELQGFRCSECGAEIVVGKRTTNREGRLLGICVTYFLENGEWDAVFFYPGDQPLETLEAIPVRGCNENIIREVIE